MVARQDRADILSGYNFCDFYLSTILTKTTKLEFQQNFYDVHSKCAFPECDIGITSAYMYVYKQILNLTLFLVLFYLNYRIGNILKQYEIYYIIFTNSKIVHTKRNVLVRLLIPQNFIVSSNSVLKIEQQFYNRFKVNTI